MKSGKKKTYSAIAQAILKCTCKKKKNAECAALTYLIINQTIFGMHILHNQIAIGMENNCHNSRSQSHVLV